MKIKKIGYYILAFIIPCILMTLLYMIAGIYPFGKNSLLTVDLAGQYIAFFNAFKNILDGSINIFYSFSKTLGGNMYGLLTYYLMSPFNLLLVFFKKASIPEFIFLINIFKISLSGLTSYIYFDKTFNNKKFTSIIFSIVYSLMAYNIVYSQNIMWLDGVYMLPIIFLGIDRLIEKEQPVLFCLSLAFSIFCSYYIGYMSCIASLAYFLYKLYLYNNYKLSWELNKNDIFYFFKYAFLAVGISMFVLLPSVFSLLVGKTGNVWSHMVPRQDYPVLDLISRFFIGSFKKSDLLGIYPHVFISLIMLILNVVYFFNKKIDTKEKKGTLIFILFFVFSMTIDVFNIIWHTFSHPVGFPYRNSFIFDFALLIVAYKSYVRIDTVESNIFKKMIPWTILIVIVMDKLAFTSNMFYKIIGSGLIIVIYLLYFYKSKNRNICKSIALLMILEMFLNGAITVYNMDYQLREKYDEFINSYGTVIDNIKLQDSSFYRIEKEYSYTTNDPLLLNYNGISHFSSTFEGQNNKLLGDYLGIFNRFYITNYLGSTPVTNSLFNIKYVLLNHKVNYYDLIDTYDDIYIYQNKYNLPIGFMVNSDVLDLKLEMLEPLENQNNILKSMSGIDRDIFERIVVSDITMYNVKKDSKNDEVYRKVDNDLEGYITYNLTVKKSGEVYYYMASEDEKKVEILSNGERVIDTNSENGYRYNVIDLGYFKKGDTIELKVLLLENSIKFKDAMFYTLNENVLSDITNSLKKENELVIIENKGNYIKANINVNKDNQILYTSIPLDKGFTILVDGKKVEAESIFDTLIGLKLEQGSHTIEFKYVPRGLKSGIAISIISVLLLIFLKKRK